MKELSTSNKELRAIAKERVVSSLELVLKLFVSRPGKHTVMGLVGEQAELTAMSLNSFGSTQFASCRSRRYDGSPHQRPTTEASHHGEVV